MQLENTQIDITYKCNLHCKHCRNGNVGHVEELDFCGWTRILNQILPLKPKNISIAGGEPLSSLFFEEFIIHIKKTLLSDTLLNISTNGTLIDNSMSDFLARNFTTVQVSLDGYDEKTNDFIRGTGSFKKTVSGINYLLENNANIVATITLNRYNHTDIIKYLELLSRLGIKHVSVKHVIPLGNASQDIDISSDEFRNSMKTVYSFTQKNKIKTYCESLFCRIEHEPEFNEQVESFLSQNQFALYGGCAMGINSVYINPQGLIIFCPYLPILCGDLKKETFEDVWNNSPMLKTARSIRYNLKGKCGRCKYKRACGGCRAYAYAKSKDILAEDTSCWINSPC